MYDAPDFVFYKARGGSSQGLGGLHILRFHVQKSNHDVRRGETARSTKRANWQACLSNKVLSLDKITLPW